MDMMITLAGYATAHVGGATGAQFRPNIDKVKSKRRRNGKGGG
jgi:hypothetical protein